MDTLYTFWDSLTHYKTESVHFLKLMNSALRLLVSPAVALSKSKDSYTADGQNPA